MRQKKFRMRVMKYAYQLNEKGFGSWSECMKQAWALYRLASQMREEVVSFLYRKTNGQFRHAYGTLRGLPAGASLNGKKVTKPSYKTMTYWDVKKQGMRCFCVERLIAVY